MTDSDEPGPDEIPLPDEVSYEGVPANYKFPERPERARFLPWHRPRKQYVREKQWTTAVREIMSDRHPEDRLKYIGLPGIDLLDLRHLLRTVCEPSGRKVQYIGFDLAAGSDSSDATELNISASELDARPLVQKPSVIRPDDLRYVARRTTAAWRALVNFGHVDVVNFDLTGNLFDTSPNGADSYLGALREILNLQVGNPNPWVLLLTTNLDRDQMSADALRPLLENFNRSADECQELSEEIAANGRVLGDPSDLTSYSSQDLRVCGLAGVLQWVLSLATSGELRSQVRVPSCFYYTSFQAGGELDMASVVVRFSRFPVDLPDPIYPREIEEPVAVEGSNPAGGNCDQLAAHYRRIASGIDIDERLNTESGLRVSMTELAADLLKEARYSRSDYIEWAATQAS